jgi:hypothetical protein
MHQKRGVHETVECKERYSGAEEGGKKKRKECKKSNKKLSVRLIFLVSSIYFFSSK